MRLNKKWTKVTLIWVGVCAYLALAITCYQNAYAEDEIDIWSIDTAQAFLADDDDSWVVSYAVTTAMVAIINAEAMGFAVSVGDVSTFDTVYDLLYKCAMVGESGWSSSISVLGNADKATHIGAATYIHFARRCTEEIKMLHAQTPVTEKDGTS